MYEAFFKQDSKNNQALKAAFVCVCVWGGGRLTSRAADPRY